MEKSTQLFDIQNDKNSENTAVNGQESEVNMNVPLLNKNVNGGLFLKLLMVCLKKKSVKFRLCLQVRL